MEGQTQAFFMWLSWVFTYTDGRTAVEGRILGGQVRRGDQLRPAPYEQALVLTLNEDPMVNYGKVTVAKAPDKASFGFMHVPEGALGVGMILHSAGATAADFDLAIQEATRAIASAAPADKAQRLRERGALYRAQGKPHEGTRDALEATYAAEAANAKKDYQPGQWVQMAGSLVGMGGTSFDMGWAWMAKREEDKKVRDERMALFNAGLVVALAYCKNCRQAVVLGKDLRCPNAPYHSPPKRIVFVMPEQVEEVQRALGAGKK